MKHAQASTVQLALTFDATAVCLRVTDDGRGFDPQRPATHEEFGLVSMRERAERIGGRFTLTSWPTHGTTVMVVVPMAHHQARRDSRMNPATPIRILIADDHPVVREGLAAMIKRRTDMTVVAEANHGQEAVALFQQHQPDVVLMDLRMPEMDGVEAILTIREQTPEARVIVLTTTIPMKTFIAPCGPGPKPIC